MSKDFVKKLQSTTEYKQAKNIMIFYPLKYEINLLEILKDKTRNFYLPKISGNNLVCCPYSEGDELCESCFKTKEPLTKPTKNPIDLVIIPALAVDKRNYRLGYGGGFYDRYLANKNICTIVCIAEKFVLDSIYPEEFDVPVDKVIIV